MTYEIRYRDEEEMKDSGIEWLGKIANDFYVKALKYSYKFTTGSTPSSGDESYYSEDGYKWLTISDMNSKNIKDTSSYISIKAIRDTNIKMNKKGSLVYSFKLSVGQVAFLEDDMYTNEAIATFDISNKNSLKFLYYMAPIFIIKNANENIYGAKLLNQNLIKNAKILIPKLEEQEKIANFLDIKTAKFDSIISKKELLIEKLEEAKKSLISEVVTGKVKIVDGELVERKMDEMKDSGVEWLGMIPKDWKKYRLKDISEHTKYSFTDGPFGSDLKSDEYVDEGIPLIQLNNIRDGKHIFNKMNFITERKFKSLIKHAAYPGEIVFAKMAEPVARCCKVSNRYEKYTIVADCIKFKPLKEFEVDTLIYLFNSDYVRIQAEILARGTTRIRINLGNLKELLVYLPKLQEQKEISRILNIKTKELNSIITKTKLQIQKLKKAKESLISEAVTGKIDLRDWEIKEI